MMTVETTTPAPAAPPPREREPKGSGWIYHGPIALPMGRGYRWTRGGIYVLSSLVDADLPDGSGEKGLQWHVSISFLGRRPKAKHVAIAREAFQMVEAEEDNHHPGVARHLFLVVDPSKRVDCECKVTEEVIVEPDGYAWTNPKAETGEACRGCKLAALKGASGKPCPIHGAARASVAKVRALGGRAAEIAGLLGKVLDVADAMEAAPPGVTPIVSGGFRGIADELQAKLVSEAGGAENGNS